MTEDMDRAEHERQAAETERERREELRRIGEGGPEQHVEGNVAPGRVEAEEQRQAAEHARNDLRRFYLKMATAVSLPVAFVALIPALVGLFWLSHVARNNHAIAVQTHNALCTFTADLKLRHDATVKFLEKHPNGIDGVSRADVLIPLKGQEATLKSLSSLEC